ncbi:MAG: type IV toxin-antitoxin system AbiEi family antitoxin domain-containing protein [Parachlamydiales bacterium]|nr:type IV toxin-antitoxin system AbiEi family antitoxin domain-containing protein [Verrucomicrobiota bacterium]MBX3719657.1 type IV toxin-antitoxin system AbiEi family antitoxin domain-containing protein [Candidatus Acheromyda pituitae]
MGKKDDLFEIADRQQGYFTAQQAVECGYSRTNFHRFLASKEWIKEQRGIYRLVHYPSTSHPDLVLWSLWSRNQKGEVQGTWSHDTALEIHELSDVMPAKMHMTVPKNFRKWTAKPKNLVLHFADLHKTEMISQQGYLVTNPLRTIADIVEEGKLSLDLIVQAIQDALRKGLISRKELHELAACKADSKFIRILNDYKI